MRKTEKLGLALYDTSDKMNITGESSSLNHNMELIDSGISDALKAAQNADAAAAAANAAAAAAQETGDYIRLHWLEDNLDEYLKKAKDSGMFDGKDGTPGADGYSPTASVTQTDTGAVITITDKTGTTTAALKNGADGQPGATGETPNIQIGTVETLAAGSSATASMDGTPENPILNLGIPQGAPGSGGGSGISVTGATVGQTVKIAAVDDNGVPTAWEPVDFPSGGVVAVARTICAPTELESGIIPSGEAAWTAYKISTTLADIQEWDEFLVEWCGMTTLSFWSFQPTGNNIQGASWLQGSSKTMYLYEWVDSDHTHIRVKSCRVGEGGVINGIESNKGAIKSSYANNVMCIADWSGIDPTTEMCLLHNIATNADITYKVWGITKKEA